MKPYKVALIIRDARPHLMDRALSKIGPFSYPVPEFEWTYMVHAKYFNLNLAELAEYDVVILHDGAFGHFTGTGPPVIGIFWDSTWTERHYLDRLAQASQCDLILIDHDQLERFRACGRPVFRFSYCVNDMLFKPGQTREIDVAFHCIMKHSETRRRMHQFLTEFCQGHGYSFAGEKIKNATEYAAAFGRARISINVTQSSRNRPHRIFDTMASGGCCLTNHLPEVSGEDCQADEHYIEFDGHADLADKIDWLLESDRWQQYANAGYEMVMAKHTWTIRARQLHALIGNRL